MAHKVDVLREHCDAVGRDIAEIEFTLGIKVTIRDTEAEADRGLEGRDGAQQDAAGRRRGRRHVLERHRRSSSPTGSRPYVELGFRTVISEQPAPYDTETFERFIGEVKPLL